MKKKIHIKGNYVYCKALKVIFSSPLPYLGHKHVVGHRIARLQFFSLN